MNTKEINSILHFFITSIILLFISQTSSAVTIKYENIVINSNITEVVTEITKSHDKTLLADKKIMEEATDLLDAVKLETASSLFGNKFITDLNNNGFQVSEYTTIDELLNTPDSDNFIANWIVNNPKKITAQYDKIRKKHNKTMTNTTTTSSPRRGLGIYSKLMLSIGILASKLPVFAAYKIPTPVPTLPANMLSACAGFARMVNKGFNVITNKPLKLTDCCKYWTSDSGLEWDGMPKLTGEQLVEVNSKICTGLESVYIILAISGVALTVALVVMIACCGHDKTRV